MAAEVTLEGLWDYCPDPDECGESDGWATRWPQSRRPCVLPLPWNLMDPKLFKYEGVVWFFRTIPALPPLFSRWIIRIRNRSALSLVR